MRSSKSPKPARPIQARTCVACRQIKVKKEMVRLVRITGGDVELDLTGKLNGRGAYLCYTRACWDRALKGNQLERHLRTSLTENNKEMLTVQIKDVLEETGSGESQ